MKTAELADVVSGAIRTAVAAPRVIAFPGMPNAAVARVAAARVVWRFSMRDRIEALQWARDASVLGYTRVVFESPGPNDDGTAGEFLLIYADGTAWASWGIGCGADGMTLWHSARGTTIGRFETLQQALASVQAAALRRQI